MIYIGQSVFVKWADQLKPAIFLGSKKEHNTTTYFVVYEDGKEDRFYSLHYFHFAKEADPKSPTGKKIYHGSLKTDLMRDIKIVVPAKDLLEKEFSALKQMMHDVIS